MRGEIVRDVGGSVGPSMEMAMKRRLIVAAVVAAIGGAPLIVPDSVQAQTKRSTANITARAALNRTLPAIDFTNVTFRDALDFLRDISQANIHINWRAIENTGITPDTVVNMKLRGVSLRKVLTLLLSEAAGGADTLAFYLDDGVLEITTKEIADSTMYIKIYDVADLLVEPPDVPMNVDFQLPSSMERSGGRGGGGGGRGGGGGGGGGGSGGSGSSIFFSDQNQRGRGEQRDKDAKANELIDLIKATVQPNVWADNGGKASIRFLNGNLVVTAPRSVHEAISGTGVD